MDVLLPVAVGFVGFSLFAVDLIGLLFFSGKGSRGEDTAKGILATALMFLFLALLFVKARRRNGYAALHDWLSRTRVFSRKYLADRDDAWPRASLSNASESRPDLPDARPKFGRYEILRR